MPIHQKHISRLLQMTTNLLNRFLNNLVSLQGKMFAVPFFFLYSRYTNNPTHKALVSSLQKIIFEAICVNTTKNCIHFICKNDFEYLTLVGVER